MRSAFGSLILLVFLIGSVQAVPTYSGSLSSADGGLIGSGGWVSDPGKPVTFSWTVTQNGDLSWHYSYVFDSTDVKGTLSHLLLETSLNLTADDIFNDTPSAGSPRLYEDGPGNPNLPGPLFGIKFESVSGAVVSIEFDSTRAPMWGDFYAKDGSVGGELWNAGFLDADPQAAADNGSLWDHILVPDTTTTIVPSPGAVLLSGIGIGLAGWFGRKKLL